MTRQMGRFDDLSLDGDRMADYDLGQFVVIRRIALRWMNRELR